MGMVVTGEQVFWGEQEAKWVRRFPWNRVGRVRYRYFKSACFGSTETESCPGSLIWIRSPSLFLPAVVMAVTFHVTSPCMWLSWTHSYTGLRRATCPGDGLPQGVCGAEPKTVPHALSTRAQACYVPCLKLKILVPSWSSVPMGSTWC